jgi:hypothetical protein
MTPEQVAEEQLYWERAIAAAKETGKFTGDDIFAACSWSSCAVGEFNELLGGVLLHYDPSGMILGPDDTYLNELGISFTYAVEEHRVDEAAEIYEEIRAAVIAHYGYSPTNPTNPTTQEEN